MYSIQSLWTAANHKLPLNFVIANNGGYRIIKQRLLAFHGDDNYIGMDFVDPPVDFCGVAKALGLEAIKVSDPGELKGVLVVGVQAAGDEADRGGGEQFGELSELNAVPSVRVSLALPEPTSAVGFGTRRSARLGMTRASRGQISDA